MKKEEWKEILKKCFGKEKDDRYHAIAMLAIYGIFILILIICIRIGGEGTNETVHNPVSTPPPISSPEIVSPTENPITNPDMDDINYSYSYTITYNGESEVYLGKKIDEKEKFTFIKNGITADYAILNDNYLILEDGTYHITESPSKFFKYCDIEKILNLVEDEISVEQDTVISYDVSNQELSFIYHDTILIDNEQNNKIQLSLINNVLKKVDLDFSNYLISIGDTANLTIHMEFADIGTTEDFQIPIQ